ncbi:hypothetical protein HY449_04610 [Candidatus Pacearchaeota archaeon]|nr:hypothetical protein [Candidatus Pacearchaeota archaeon]
MNKRGKNQGFLRRNFFPKNSRGQFFLILIVIIITVIAGLASVVNFVEKKGDARFYYAKDELEFESAKVIDYCLNNADSCNMKNQLTTFAQDYSEYSNADDFYYIFGTTSEITLAGCKKINDGDIKIEDSSGAEKLLLHITKGSCDTLASGTLNSPPQDIFLAIDDAKYKFTLNQGENFFFVVSKEIEGDVYTIANG